MNIETRVINLEDINFNDDTFKVTSYNIDQRLRESIETWGLITQPILLKSQNKFIIIKGHDRLKICRDFSHKEILCQIVDEVSGEFFLQQAALALYEKKMGFFGILKTIDIGIQLHHDEQLLNSFVKFSSIPYKFINQEERKTVLKKIPLSLQAYMDSRDVNYKVVIDLMILSDNGCRLLSEMVATYSLKVNNFKKIIDWMVDLEKNNISIDVNHCTDENEIVSALFRLRFPRFHELKGRADEIKKKLSKKGLTIKFNESLESSAIDLQFTIKSINDLNDSVEMIQRMDQDLVKELISILT